MNGILLPSPLSTTPRDFGHYLERRAPFKRLGIWGTGTSRRQEEAARDKASEKIWTFVPLLECLRRYILKQQPKAHSPEKKEKKDRTDRLFSCPYWWALEISVFCKGPSFHFLSFLIGPGSVLHVRRVLGAFAGHVTRE